jgi:hypothetical protein
MPVAEPELCTRDSRHAAEGQDTFYDTVSFTAPSDKTSCSRVCVIDSAPGR